MLGSGIARAQFPWLGTLKTVILGATPKETPLMPPRIQATHPWYPRLRLPYRGQGAQPRGGGGRGRGAVSGAVDTTPTGSIGGDIIKAIGNTIQQNRQNAIANQIMNTQTPPRAGAVGPVVNPATGQVTSN